jgi:hypothetical protein
MNLREVCKILTEAAEVFTAFIIRVMMETDSVSEPSVSFYETARRNVPEDGHRHTHGQENLKSHLL